MNSLSFFLVDGPIGVHDRECFSQLQRTVVVPVVDHYLAGNEASWWSVHAAFRYCDVFACYRAH